MDSRTRFSMALNHEKPDRAPFNFWMDRRLMQQYEERIGRRHWRVTHYGADVIESFPRLPFPAGRFEEQSGTPWLVEPYPLNWDAIDRLPMPDADAADMFDDVKRDLDEFPDKAVVCNVQTPFGYVGNMVGHESIYFDMVDRYDAFCRLCDRIGAVLNRAVERACDLGVAAIYIQEDLTSAQGLLMSPEFAWRFSLDHARQMTEIAHAAGLPVLFHCCGKVDSVLPMFEDVGVQAVNPMQPHLNNLREFKAQHGRRLAIYGGLDNSFVLSSGSTEDVRQHVLDVFATVGTPDGALVFSSHDMDIATPPENVETMVETIVNECTY